MKDLMKYAASHTPPLHISAQGVDVDVLGGSHRGSSHTLLDFRGPPRFDAIYAHVHLTCAEWLLVQEGQIECTINGKISVLTAGDYIEVPPRVLHSWRNPTEHPFRVLIGFSDPDMDGYFFELFDLLNDPNLWPTKDRAAILDLNARYQTEVVAA